MPSTNKKNREDKRERQVEVGQIYKPQSFPYSYLYDSLYLVVDRCTTDTVIKYGYPAFKGDAGYAWIVYTIGYTDKGSAFDLCPANWSVFKTGELIE